jgi:phage-related protein
MFRYDNWEFPKEIEVVDFDGDGLRIRSSVTERAFSHGGVDTADGKISSRQLKLKVKIYGRNETEHKKLEDDFKFHLLQGKKRLYPDMTRYINVTRVSNVSHKWLNNVNFKLASEIELTMVCEDPFWYFGNVMQEETIVSSPHDFTVFNTGNVEAFPIIVITANADNPAMTLKNETDNLLFSYIDANFLSGDVLVIDCIKGTVQKNGISSIKFFSGSFIKLLHGANAMKYTGANSSIKLEYTNRYL